MVMGAYEITSRANTVQGGRFSLRPGGFDRTASTISAVGESLPKVVSTGSAIAAAVFFPKRAGNISQRLIRRLMSRIYQVAFKEAWCGPGHPLKPPTPCRFAGKEKPFPPIINFEFASVSSRPSAVQTFFSLSLRASGLFSPSFPRLFLRERGGQGVSEMRHLLASAVQPRYLYNNQPNILLKIIYAETRCSSPVEERIF